MSYTRAFLELASRLKPQINKPRLQRPTSAKLARAERAGARFVDPFQELNKLAHTNPEVYGGLVFWYQDEQRPHASDPQKPVNILGTPESDGSE